MKIIALTAAALIATTAGAYAAMGGAISGTVTQTTVLNGPYGGDAHATTIANQQRAIADIENRRVRHDRLGYTKLLELDGYRDER